MCGGMSSAQNANFGEDADDGYDNVNLECGGAYACMNGVGFVHAGGFTGQGSCANCDILPTTGDGIRCGGYQSCQNFVANDHERASQEVSCSGAESCSGITSSLGLRTKGTSKISCMGKDACYQGNVKLLVDDSETSIHCTGSGSCSETELVGVPQIHCNGKHSCQDAYISAIPGSSDSLTVSVAAQEGALGATINGVETINGNGYRALANAVIDSKLHDMVLHLGGHMAADGAQMICRRGQTCTVNCDGPTACTGLDIRCDMGATCAVVLVHDQGADCSDYTMTQSAIAANPTCFAQGPCYDGYMDITNGNSKWWACGVHCAGGLHRTTGTCACACISDQSGCTRPDSCPAITGSTGTGTGRSYAKYTGKTCSGTKQDTLREYAGTAAECQTKCEELDCVGFVRVNSDDGTNEGKCFFRGGELNHPEANTFGDNRDCFVPQPTDSQYLVRENTQVVIELDHNDMECIRALDNDDDAIWDYQVKLAEEKGYDVAAYDLDFKWSVSLDNTFEEDKGFELKADARGGKKPRPTRGPKPSKLDRAPRVKRPKPTRAPKPTKGTTQPSPAPPSDDDGIYDCRANVKIDSYGDSNIKVFVDEEQTEYYSVNDIFSTSATVKDLDESVSLELQAYRWPHPMSYAASWPPPADRFGAMKAIIKVEAVDENGNVVDSYLEGTRDPITDFATTAGPPGPFDYWIGNQGWVNWQLIIVPALGDWVFSTKDFGGDESATTLDVDFGVGKWQDVLQHLKCKSAGSDDLDADARGGGGRGGGGGKKPRPTKGPKPSKSPKTKRPKPTKAPKPTTPPVSSAIACTKERECQKDKLTGYNLIACQGTSACTKATIETVANGEVQCMGKKSCSEAMSISAAGGKIICGGEESCEAYMTADSIECNGHDSCTGLVKAREVRCRGDYSCSSNSQQENAETVECSGAYSCWSRHQDIVLSKELICSGLHSCESHYSGDYKVIAPFVECSGESSCEETVIASDEVELSGYRAAQEARIAGSASIVLGGAESAAAVLKYTNGEYQGSFIDSVGLTEMSLKFYGKQAGSNAKVMCRAGSTCAIMCRNSGCQHMTIEKEEGSTVNMVPLKCEGSQNYDKAVDDGIICPTIVSVPVGVDAIMMSVGHMIGAQEVSNQVLYGYATVVALLTMIVLTVYKVCTSKKNLKQEEEYVAV